MSLLNKLTIKNLKLNKKRTIVTIIGIMLSVALISAVANMYTSLITSLINFEVKEQGNFHTAIYNVPIADIPNFNNNRTIEDIYLTKNIGYAKINSQNEYKPYAYLKAFSLLALENLSVQLVDGRLPQNQQEILIPTHLKTNGRLDLKIGDKITLDIGKRVTSNNYELDQSNPYHPYVEDEELEEQLIDTNRQTFTIVGIIERPASNVESYSAPGFTFITYLDEEKIDGLVDVYVKFKAKDVKNAYENTANILGVDAGLFKKYATGGFTFYDSNIHNLYDQEMQKAKYPNFNLNTYLISLQTNPIADSSIGSLGIVVSIVIIIIIFTSVFCIKNSFEISITEKIKQYGMLRSIGATKKQIKKNVFYEASILGLIGIPLGILSGFIASYILVIISNYYLKDVLANSLKLEFSLSIWAIMIAIVLGIITIYLSAFKSAKKAAKISPIDSIRNAANIKINAKKVKSPLIIRKIFGIGGEISYKNLKRNKKKYRTTVVSIIVSVFVFIALSSFMNMAFDAIKNEFKVSEYNIDLVGDTQSLNDSQNKEVYTKKLIDTTTLDNIADYTILKENYLLVKDTKFNQEYIDWFNYNFKESRDSYLAIYALGDYQYEKYLKSLGKTVGECQDKGILVNYMTATRYNEEKNKDQSKYLSIYDYNTGDILTLENDLKEQYSLEIVEITDKNPFGLKNFSGAKLIVSDSLYEKIANPQKESLEIFFKSTNANKLQDDIDKLLENENYHLNNLEENVLMMQNLFTLLGIFLYGFIIVITLIGITNIFNTITTSMHLRRQELAMLKSIGMTNKEFRRMIRLESLFIGLKALLFGLPIGLGLSYLIYYFLNYEEGLPYHLPLMAIIIAVVAVLILISLIMRYSLNKINKQNTIQTIRNENI